MPTEVQLRPNTFSGSGVLQRVRCWAGQAPTQARGRIIQLDHTFHTLLRHLFKNRRAEPTPLRRRHERRLDWRAEGLACEVAVLT
jgi:hypothetical protein